LDVCARDGVTVLLAESENLMAARCIVADPLAGRGPSRPVREPKPSAGPTKIKAAEERRPFDY